MAQAISKELRGPLNEDVRYGYLLVKVNRDEMREKSSYFIEQLVDNPIRGALLHHDAINRIALGVEPFVDVTERKVELLSVLRDQMKDARSRSQAIQSLWRIGISEQCGVDMNWLAISSLLLEPASDGDLIDRLKHISSEDSRKGNFASYVLYRSGMLPYDAVSRKLSTIRIEKNIIHAAEGFSLAFGESAETLKAEIYRTDYAIASSNHPTETFEEAEVRLATEFNRKYARIRQDYEDETLAPLGIEIQGLNARSIPAIGTQNGTTFTAVSPKDYEFYRDILHGIPSPDKPFELALFPSKSAYELSLQLQTLYKAGLIQGEKGPTGLDITIAGLKSSPEKYREGQALQIMMLAADFGQAKIVMDYTAYQLPWDVEGRAGVADNKSATRSRNADELLSVSGEQEDVATEMRIFVMDAPEQNYRLLPTIQQVGSLGIQHQKAIDGKPYVAGHDDAWNSLVAGANRLFSTYHLPPVESIWTYEDLKNLHELLESGRGKALKDGMRTLLTVARIARRGDLGVAVEDHDTVRDESVRKRSSLVMRALDGYESMLVQARTSLMKKGKTAQQVMEFADVLRTFLIPVGMIGVLGPSVMQLGMDVPVARTLVTAFVGIEALGSAEIWIPLMKSVRDSVNQRRPLLPKELLKKLTVYQTGLIFSTLNAFFFSVSDRDPRVFLWHMAGLTALTCAKKLMKPVTQMESRWRIGHR